MTNTSITRNANASVSLFAAKQVMSRILRHVDVCNQVACLSYVLQIGSGILFNADVSRNVFPSLLALATVSGTTKLVDVNVQLSKLVILESKLSITRIANASALLYLSVSRVTNSMRGHVVVKINPI